MLESWLLGDVVCPWLWIKTVIDRIIDTEGSAYLGEPDSVEGGALHPDLFLIKLGWDGSLMGA